MTQLLAKSNIYPSPDNETAKGAMGNIWDVLNEMLYAPEVDITCAATLDIGAVLSSRVRVTGSAVNITSLGTNYRGPIYIRTSSAYFFDHNGTSLICHGGADLWVPAGSLLSATPKSDVSGVANGWYLTLLSRGDGGWAHNNTVTISGNIPLSFQGTTNDSFYTQLYVTEPTAIRTITIPNANVDLAAVRDATTSLAGFGRVATWPEAQAGSMGGNIFLNPDSFNWARNFSPNGYMRFPGTPGLLMQWGTTPYNTDVGNVVNITGTFPIPFTGGIFVVVPVVNANMDCYVQWRQAATTLTQPAFTIRETTGAVQSGTWGVSWLAVGW